MDMDMDNGKFPNVYCSYYTFVSQTGFRFNSIPVRQYNLQFRVSNRSLIKFQSGLKLNRICVTSPPMRYFRFYQSVLRASSALSDSSPSPRSLILRENPNLLCALVATPWKTATPALYYRSLGRETY